MDPRSHAWLSRHRRAPLTPGWPPLAGQRSSAAAACAQARPGQVHHRRSPARLPTTSAGSPTSRPTRAVDPAARDTADHVELDPFRVVRVARRTDVIPMPPPGFRGRDGGDRTDGWTPAGRTPDGRTPVGRTAGSRTTEQMTGHRTAGHRITGHPDVGTEWVDTEWWTRTGDRRHGRRPAIPGRCNDALPLGRRPQAPPARRGLVDQQPGQLSRRTLPRGRPPPRSDSGR